MEIGIMYGMIIGVLTFVLIDLTLAFYAKYRNIGENGKCALWVAILFAGNIGLGVWKQFLIHSGFTTSSVLMLILSNVVLIAISVPLLNYYSKIVKSKKQPEKEGE